MDNMVRRYESLLVKAAWQNEIINNMTKASGILVWCTLTFKPKIVSPTDNTAQIELGTKGGFFNGYHNSQPSITLFRERADRFYEDMRNYCNAGSIVSETGKYGRRHLHMLVKVARNAWRMFLSAMRYWEKEIGFVKLDETINKVSAVTKYVSKYINKDFEKSVGFIPTIYQWKVKRATIGF